MKYFKIVSFIVLFNFLMLVSAFADTYVRGYTKKNGTYVAPHYRSSPDSSTSNNWSTKGNVNPYTGKRGTKNPTSGNSGRSYSGSQATITAGTKNNKKEQALIQFDEMMRTWPFRNDKITGVGFVPILYPSIYTVEGLINVCEGKVKHIGKRAETIQQGMCHSFIGGVFAGFISNQKSICGSEDYIKIFPIVKDYWKSHPITLGGSSSDLILNALNESYICKK